MKRKKGAGKNGEVGVGEEGEKGEAWRERKRMGGGKAVGVGAEEGVGVGEGLGEKESHWIMFGLMIFGTNGNLFLPIST